MHNRFWQILLLVLFTITVFGNCFAAEKPYTKEHPDCVFAFSTAKKDGTGNDFYLNTKGVLDSYSKQDNTAKISTYMVITKLNSTANAKKQTMVFYFKNGNPVKMESGDKSEKITSNINPSFKSALTTLYKNTNTSSQQAKKDKPIKRSMGGAGLILLLAIGSLLFGLIKYLINRAKGKTVSNSNEKQNIQPQNERNEVMDDKPAAKKKFCAHCGAPLDENSKFCSKCGTPVN